MAGRLLATLILVLSLNTTVWSQTGGLLPASQPQWKQLNAQQRTALAPLAREWNSLSDARKLKWLGIAQRFADLDDVEQARTQDRMREWIALSPAQRELARIQYKQLRNSPPAQRRDLEQKWKEYQALSEDEKARLRGKAPQAPARSPATTPVEAASAPTSRGTTQARPPKALTLGLPKSRSRPAAAPQAAVSTPVPITPEPVPAPPPEEEIESE